MTGGLHLSCYYLVIVRTDRGKSSPNIFFMEHFYDVLCDKVMMPYIIKLGRYHSTNSDLLSLVVARVCARCGIYANAATIYL